MRSIIDELRNSPPDALPLSKEAILHVEKMNTLYQSRAITYNELCMGLGGQGIGVAGDRFAGEDPNPIARNSFADSQSEDA